MILCAGKLNLYTFNFLLLAKFWPKHKPQPYVEQFMFRWLKVWSVWLVKPNIPISWGFNTGFSFHWGREPFSPGGLRVYILSEFMFVLKYLYIVHGYAININQNGSNQFQCKCKTNHAGYSELDWLSLLVQFSAWVWRNSLQFSLSVFFCNPNPVTINWLYFIGGWAKGVLLNQSCVWFMY